METLAMSAVLYAEVFYRRGARAVLLILAAPVLGLIVNQARVLSLVLNPFSEFAAVHTAQGIAMLIAGVLAVAALDGLLGRLLPPRLRPSWTPTRLTAQDLTQGIRLGTPRILALCVLLCTVGASTLLLPPWWKRSAQLPLLSTLPVTLGEWKAAGLPLDEQFFGSVGFGEWVHRSYSRDDSVAEVFLGSNNRMEPRMSLISPKTEIPGPGYTLLEKSRIELEPDGWPASRLVMDRHKPVLVYHWYQGVDSFPWELFRSALALDRGPFRRPGRSVVVRVSTPLPRLRSERGKAESELLEFVGLLRAALARIAPAET